MLSVESIRRNPASGGQARAEGLGLELGLDSVRKD